jgi:hypothetical protein
MRCWLCLGLLAATAAGCGAPDEQAPRGGAPAPKAVQEAAPAGGEVKAPERKIIYTAQVDLVVDNFEKAEADLLQLVQGTNSYIAKSELHGVPGTPRRGTWTVRVPAPQFSDFLSAAGKLGELQRSSTDSKDITDAYYDLQAHIKNDETREQGLRKLYDSKATTGKLEDLLAIDRELSIVRGKIDTQKGQMLRWDKEVAFSTVTVTMQDRRAYVPPVPASFTGSVGRAFSGSIEALVEAGKFLVLVVVALAPWLAVAVVLGLPVWYWYRRRRLRRM